MQSNAGIIYDDWNGTEQPYNKDAAVYLEALTLTSSYAQRCVPRQHEIIVNKIKEKNRSYEDEDEEFNPLKTPTTVSKFKGLKKLMSLKQHVDISVNKTLSKYSLQTPDGSFKIRKKIVNNAIAKTNSELNVLTLRSNTSYQRSVSSSSPLSSSSAATAVTTGAESSVPEMTTKVTKMSGFKVLDTLSASSTWSSWSSSSSVAIAAASNGNTETTMINTKELNFLHSQQQEILQEICNSKAGYARLEQMHNKLIATTTASNEVSQRDIANLIATIKCNTEAKKSLELKKNAKIDHQKKVCCQIIGNSMEQISNIRSNHLEKLIEAKFELNNQEKINESILQQNKELQYKLNLLHQTQSNQNNNQKNQQMQNQMQNQMQWKKDDNTQLLKPMLGYNCNNQMEIQVGDRVEVTLKPGQRSTTNQGWAMHCEGEVSNVNHTGDIEIQNFDSVIPRNLSISRSSASNSNLKEFTEFKTPDLHARTSGFVVPKSPMPGMGGVLKLRNCSSSKKQQMIQQIQQSPQNPRERGVRVRGRALNMQLPRRELDMNSNGKRTNHSSTVTPSSYRTPVPKKRAKINHNGGAAGSAGGGSNSNSSSSSSSFSSSSYRSGGNRNRGSIGSRRNFNVNSAPKVKRKKKTKNRGRTKNCNGNISFT